MSSTTPAPVTGGDGLAVEVEGITKRFPGVVANRDVTFGVRRGTVHAIVGENGAGKSTLMKMLYGVQKPDEGTIRINGEPVTMSSPSEAIKHGVGMVFQHFMLADNLTVTENVVLGAERLHGIRGGARAEITRISDEYGLDIDPDASSPTSASGRASASRSSRCSTGGPARSSSTSRPPCSCPRRSRSSSTTCVS